MTIQIVATLANYSLVLSTWVQGVLIYRQLFINTVSSGAARCTVTKVVDAEAISDGKMRSRRRV